MTETHVMADFFERLARGFDAAQKAIGADELARTNGFDLEHSAVCPIVTLRRRRSGGEIVVDVSVSDARATMTVAEFERFVEELQAFRAVVAGAAQAAQGQRGGA